MSDSQTFDLGQHLFDTCNAMNKARMMELGLTPAPSAIAHQVEPDHIARHVTEMLGIVDMIAGCCDDPKLASIARRAAENLYRLGRIHETLESLKATP